MYTENSSTYVWIHFLNTFNIFGYIFFILVFETTALLEMSVQTSFLWLLLPDLIGSLISLLIANP